MQFQIPISSLFTQVFGVASPLVRRYKLTEEESKRLPGKYNVNLTPVEKDDEEFDSTLGTPVQFPMAFLGGNYNKRNNGIINQISVEGMRLPYTSVASFSQAKRITETYMSGHEGSVIEEFGFESWQIRIQGLIIKENDYKLQSVANQVQELLIYKGLSDSIGVKGKVFEWYGISQVAILDINFPSARDLDMSVVKPYEIILKSVKPLELIIP